MALTPVDQAQLNDAISALARARGRADTWAADLVARYPDESRVHVSHGWWIFKPAALAGGQGMHLTRAPAALRDIERGIAQRYVHPPLLLSGRKFNVRLLYCLHSIDPLRVFLWRDGWVFVAGEDYSAPLEGEASNAHVVNLLRAKPADIGRPIGLLPAHVASLQTMLDSGMVNATAMQDGIKRLAAALTGALSNSGFFVAVNHAGVS